MTNFNEADRDAYLATLNTKDIIDSITLLDVKNFLESLGVEQIDVNEEKQYLVCPTICHNPIHEAESMKLYWYQNNKIFRCYTECDEAMSIFQLYQKYMALNQYPITLEEAENYVKQFLKHIIITTKRSNRFENDIEKYKYTANIPALEEYSPVVLDYFTKYYHPLWLKDGITKEAMDKFQKQYLFSCQIGKVLYTHPLQFNLYGIYEHQNGIIRRRSAIIAEAEKSVLLDEGYYGEWSNCVACCGSTFNKYHISLLTDILGANEIVVALDKEYTDWRTEKAKKYRNKIERMCKKYSNRASFSYIWDFDNLLNEKDSPFDKGKEVFEELYKNRIKVRG